MWRALLPPAELSANAIKCGQAGAERLGIPLSAIISSYDPLPLSLETWGENTKRFSFQDREDDAGVCARSVVLRSSEANITIILAPVSNLNGSSRLISAVGGLCQAWVAGLRSK